MARNAKQALIDRKEELTREIKYYDMRIKEARKRLAEKNNNCYDESSSSDSEIEFEIRSGPSDNDLKVSTFTIQTCIQATQELTTLEVLDSEVNIMVDDPVIEGEPPIKEDGIWKEVLTECRVDLIPFSMTFYSHHSKRLFGPIQYRGLQVKLVKPAHEEELSKSVLPDVTTPSDAVEVLRSYAEAHRSRRSTLARLVKKYGDLLFMEPMTGGGYTLKCANILEISWTLLNRWSPIAPFQHKMKFDLEYMDESYIKIITQTHKQLSDPSVDTDERTLLLDKIIETCLKARKDAGEDSEAESNKQTDESGNVKNIKDSDIMAPPKTLPKKVKPKKRPNDNPASESKKPKIDDKENQMFATNNNKQKIGEAGSSVPNNQIATSKNYNNDHTDTTKSKNKKGVDNEINKVTNNKPQTKTAKDKNASGNTKPQSAKNGNDNIKQKENNIEVISKEKQTKDRKEANNDSEGTNNKKNVAATNSKDQNNANVAISKEKRTAGLNNGKSSKVVRDNNVEKTNSKYNNDNVANVENKTTKADTVDGKVNKIDKDSNEKKVVNKINSKHNTDNVAILKNKITKPNSVKTDKSSKTDKDQAITKSKITANKADAAIERNSKLDKDDNKNIKGPRKDTVKSNSKNNNDNVAIAKNNTDTLNPTDKNSKKIASSSSKNNNNVNVAISKDKIADKDNDVNIAEKKLKKVSSTNSKNSNNDNVDTSKHKITKDNEDNDLTDKNSKSNNNNVAMLKNNDAMVRLEKNKIGKNLKSKLLNIESEVPFKKPKVVNVLDRPNASKPYMQTLKDRFANKNSVASGKNVDRGSKIPQRIKALDARGNVSRFSPRLSHKSTFSTRINGN